MVKISHFPFVCLIICIRIAYVKTDNLCKSYVTVAVCSGYGNNLTYIPSLPRRITNLRFCFNRLRHVSGRTFVNVTSLKLETLHLVGDHIETITHTAFQQLRYLTYLDISHNVIPTDIIAGSFIGLSRTPIQRLDMLAMGIHSLPPRFFDSLNVSKINIIHLHQNYLTLFDCRDFWQLKYLKRVGMGENLIYRLVFTPECELAELDLSFNSIKDVCKDGISSTSLKLLNVSSNGIYKVDTSTFKCFPNLEELVLGGNYFPRLYQNTFSALSKLNLLSMIMNVNLKYISAGAFNNSNIRKLLLMNAGDLFHHYNWDMFTGCNLKYLDISQNNLNKFTTEALQTLFEPLRNTLRTLIISDASLTTIPAFVSMLSKLNSLKLNNNLITTWASNSLQTLNCLQYLDLSRNDISIVTEDSIPDNILRSMETFDISDNPFDCSCANLWFLRVFQSHLDIFDNSAKSCQCSSPARMVSTLLRNIHMTSNSCLLTFTSQLIVIISAIVFVTMFVIGILLYQYRWHLRYLLYMYNNGQHRQRHEVNQDFLYDVFVVYSSEDSDWIIDTLLPKLEGELELKVCVHERNFVPGRLIVDNIVSSIETSKKIMIVLSNSFSQRDWCQFELNVVQRHVLENGQDLLVVVVLEQLNRRHMTPTMFTMLQTTTYIQWPDDVDSEDGFWNNLTVAFRAD